MTIGALHAVEYLTGIHSAIMGQGDNQVIVISWKIPHVGLSQHDYIRNYQHEFNTTFDTYLSTLTRVVNGMGMEIKLEETWISTRFLSYGKEPWMDEVFMTIILKKICRMFLEVNDVHPTISNRVGAILSAEGHST